MSEELIKRLREQARDAELFCRGDYASLLHQAADALSRPAPVQVPDEWAAVPMMPTDEMMLAFDRIFSQPTNAYTRKTLFCIAYADMLATAPSAPAAHEAEAQGVDVDDARITEIALANGFKLKPQPDGRLALNPYVFDFARALLSASPSASGWQPIETAPKDGRTFIATGFNYGKDGGPRHYCMALWEQGEWREASEWNGHSSLAYLTHWQPLPPPPAIANQEASHD